MAARHLGATVLVRYVTTRHSFDLVAKNVELAKVIQTNGACFLFLLLQQIPLLDGLGQNSVVDVALLLFVVLPVLCLAYLSTNGSYPTCSDYNETA
jgi:hypothetical protein